MNQIKQSLPSRVKDGVMLHAYLWPFKKIEENLERIANAGYNSIQVSPVTKTKATGLWAFLYQPCSFHIGNEQLGSYEDFVSLCESAEKYGIRIIVDAVFNHVADNGNLNEWHDSIDEELKNKSLYNNLDSITDYQNREQVVSYSMGTLPNFKTSNKKVQEIHLNFLNECVQAGAGGFRFDAAKHLPTNIGEDEGKPWASDYWDVILNNLQNKDNLYLFGEAIPDARDNTEAYRTYYDITAHGYGRIIRDAVTSKNLSNIIPITHGRTVLEPKESLAYLENHDDYEYSESKHLSPVQIKQGYSILTARAELTPRFLIRPEENLWYDDDIRAINLFHNNMIGEIENISFPRKETIVIERGNKGLVIVNAGNDYYLDMNTSLSDGTYTNKGTNDGKFTVLNGTLQGNIPSNSVVILYK